MADTHLTFASRQVTPTVLLPLTDGELLVAPHLRRAFAPHLRFALADKTLVEAVRQGALPCPGRGTAPSPAAIPGVRADEGHPREPHFRFPLVIKPLTRRAERWRPIEPHAKALRVADAPGLARLWRRSPPAISKFSPTAAITGPGLRDERPGA